MAELFNEDFSDFLKALHRHNVEYILVGGYAVILHGYVRSTSDMDVWVNKTKENYLKLSVAFLDFGAPIMSEDDFLGSEFDVWSIGMEPNKIEIMNEVKGLDFDGAYSACEKFLLKDTPVNYIHIRHLLQAKKAAGRFKDKADIEELEKRKKI